MKKSERGTLQYTDLSYGAMIWTVKLARNAHAWDKLLRDKIFVSNMSIKFIISLHTYWSTGEHVTVTDSQQIVFSFRYCKPINRRARIVITCLQIRPMQCISIYHAVRIRNSSVAEIVSEQFLNGTSAHIRSFSGLQWCEDYDKSVKL